MNDRVINDPRMDPRIKAALRSTPVFSFPNVSAREELSSLAEQLAIQPYQHSSDLPDYETIAPSAGLDIRTCKISSQPDGNEILLQTIKPGGSEKQACVYYIHGGGMMMGSCFAPNLAAWGRLIASAGVTVVMVEFRNSLVPSSVDEVGPFPAGLNDCVSGLRWLLRNAGELGIDPGRIIVAGESGGANLSIALAMTMKRENTLSSVAGLYLMCPFLSAEANSDPRSSEVENDNILNSGPKPNAFAVAYGIEQVTQRNPAAWPAYASTEDVAGFPETIITVNECDTLRDDGVNFYRLLLQAGVPTRCRQLMGTIHGTEVDVAMCPDISRDAARELAHFAMSAGPAIRPRSAARYNQIKAQRAAPVR